MITAEQLQLGRANLEEFSATLTELAERNKDIIVVTSDSRGSGKLVAYGKKFPAQLVEVGIAEQNLVGVAAGLTSAGKKVFAVSPACFLTSRSLEQIKNDVTYSNQPVVLVGISAGVSYGALGSTHHSLHDVAVLRAIHNIQIIVPADNFETREAVRAAAVSKTPVYLKFGKKPMPVLPRTDNGFKIGKASIICHGNDIAFIASGETVAPAYEAARLLEESNVHARVLSMHTIKPLDVASIRDAALNCKAMITVEEQSVHGGLGEACAAFLMQEAHSLPFRIVGIPDEETVAGSQQEIFQHYGITGTGLTETALKLLK